MSTRSNIIIDLPRGKKVYLYHHYDGYPSGLGWQLVRFLNNNWHSFDDQSYQHYSLLIDEILKGKCEKQFYDYEKSEDGWKEDNSFMLIPSRSDMAGDSEYDYTIKIRHNKPVHITCQKVRAWEEERVVFDGFVPELYEQFQNYNEEDWYKLNAI